MTTRPLAFIYDRHATEDTTVLEMRLKACAKYVSAQGWGFGGWWVDKGDDALTDDRRPAFDILLHTLQATSADHPRVCLVHDFERLSRDDQARRIFTRRILLTGGWGETTRGETTKPGDNKRGLLTTPRAGA
ncbi:MAG: recombinase family protein [Streptomycetaceae bacterium]|nr:recombinase family protein [Streptomycetaceae bacterium]